MQLLSAMGCGFCACALLSVEISVTCYQLHSHCQQVSGNKAALNHSIFSVLYFIAMQVLDKYTCEIRIIIVYSVVSI